MAEGWYVEQPLWLAIATVNHNAVNAKPISHAAFAAQLRGCGALAGVGAFAACWLWWGGEDKFGGKAEVDFDPSNYNDHDLVFIT